MARLVLSLLLLACACKGRDDLDGRRRPILGLSERVQEHSLVADAAHVVLDLFDNRAAAVVYQRGSLVIECGTVDMARYVDGGYRSPWHLAADDGGERAALVNGLAGELYVPVDTAPGGVARDAGGSVRISMRARAAAPQQLVSVFLNEVRLGDIAMPETAWRSYSIRAPASTVVAGENRLRFYFRHTGDIDGKRTAAAIQRIGIGAGSVPGVPVVQSETVRRGQRSLAALRVARAARLSYYVAVPDAAPALVFAAAGEDAELAVHITSGDAGPGAAAEQVWTARGTGEWTESRVDLSKWAGEVVRVDLVSTGAADWGRPQLVVPAAHAPVPRWSGKPADHVIVWVVSALRADRLAGPEVPTPGFARLASRGMRFENAFTAAAVPGAAHVAMLAGIRPRSSSIPAGIKTLGERFSEAGYTTALISGNGFVNDDAGFASGFAVYKNPMRRRHPFRARALWQEARSILQRHRDGRTFSYLVTVEPHLPYTPSPESLAAQWDREPMRFDPARTIALSESVAAGTESLTPVEQSYIRALYDAEVRDADAAFAEMLANLDELGVADRTAIILVSDHGEELWERGGFGHGRHLYQEVVHVPLVVAPPDVSAPVVVDSDVSLTDVYATALALAGITAGPGSQGRSMLGKPSLVPAPIFSYLPGVARSLKLGRYKLIVPAHGDHEVYDLAVDPGERSDLAGSRPIIERYLRTIFGIGVAYQSVWSQRRWGAVNDMTPAFAADHGL